MTGVSECSQQRGNLKDDGYRLNLMKYGVLEKSNLIISCYIINFIILLD
ncbi:hypothetical protein [Photorhabdus laumondii]